MLGTVTCRAAIPGGRRARRSSPAPRPSTARSFGRTHGRAIFPICFSRAPPPKASFAWRPPLARPLTVCGPSLFSLQRCSLESVILNDASPWIAPPLLARLARGAASRARRTARFSLRATSSVTGAAGVPPALGPRLVMDSCSIASSAISSSFYDRPYDNLWRNVSNNNFKLGEFSITTPTANYLAPAAQVLAQFAGQTVDKPFPLITWIDARIRNAYVWSSFVGVQQERARHITLEVNGLETLGRRLVSTDVLNRGSNPMKLCLRFTTARTRAPPTTARSPRCCATARPASSSRPYILGATTSTTRVRRWPAISSTSRSSASPPPPGTGHAPHSPEPATSAPIAATPISISARTWF